MGCLASAVELTLGGTDPLLRMNVHNGRSRFRRLVAMFAATGFALIWAVLQWPWVRHADDARGGQIGAWLFIAYFVLLAASLRLYPAVGRWLALATGALLLLFILLVIPAALGVAQFICIGADWRCYVESIALCSTGATLVATCARPIQDAPERSAA